ncbi:hypothetical protein [Nocardia brasiliensis]|uniref:hypothetical protein n=1 Tax=Nocardia brasiliensis TaxID=37326 RepID=UPI0024574AEE|nr:hypothetical protein [Nocardia brasiliensis]
MTHAATRNADSDIELAPRSLNLTVVAAGALTFGLVLLLVALANLDRMPGRADNYGAILVYLAFFLYMSIAGRLTWWGIDTIHTRLKEGRSRR